MARRNLRNNQTGYINALLFTAWTLTVFASHCDGAVGAVYDDVSRLFDDKLGTNSTYKTTIRPVINQTQIIQVNVAFDVIAIVEINAISQKFVVNGFLGLDWTDEILAWDPEQYNHVYIIHPEPKQIWRPRLILTNTVENRDLFEDDYSPTTSVFNGWTGWYPGSLFPTSCKLNLYKYPFDEQNCHIECSNKTVMRDEIGEVGFDCFRLYKYPFDEQNCHIEMYSMGWGPSEVKFRSRLGKVGTDYFVESGEWSLINTSLVAVSALDDLPHFKISFKLQRLPGFFIVNIVIPIVLMSFLNILVFIIPVDSGEKISYGITVLLALTVFMSIVSEQLPRSSDTLPIVTIYLLVLNVISVCTVIVSIIIVYCHHRQEKEVKHKKAVTGFKSMFHKFKIMNNAAKNFSTVNVKPATGTGVPFSTTNSSSSSSSPVTKVDGNLTSNSYGKKMSRDAMFNVHDELKENHQDTNNNNSSSSGSRWKMVGKHLDCVSFIVFTLVWISVTIGFLVEIAR